MFKNMKKTIVATVAIAALSATAFANNNRALEESNITAQQAANIASQQVKGQISHVDFESHFNGAYYEVDVWANGKKHEIRIDADDGKVIRNQINRDDDDNDAPNARISLLKAMSVAEQHTNGKIKEAEWDDGYFEITILKNNEKQKVLVDGNGQIVSIQRDRDND